MRQRLLQQSNLIEAVGQLLLLQALQVGNSALLLLLLLLSVAAGVYLECCRAGLACQGSCTCRTHANRRQSKEHGTLVRLCLLSLVLYNSKAHEAALQVTCHHTSTF